MKLIASRVLNYLLFLLGCLMLGTGALLSERLPSGREGRGLTVLGMGRHDWGEVHEWLGWSVGIGVALHLLLHIAWLRKVATRGRMGLLFLGGAIGVAAALFFLIAPVQGGRGEGGSEGRAGRGEHHLSAPGAPSDARP